MFKISLPDGANYIIEKLQQNGFEAYVVGGCVRDSVLNKEPKDWDITTSANPLEVKKIFGRTIDTGIKHGTVTIMIDKEGYEVTTYRIDGDYQDHRRPTEVIFSKSLEEDLKRRDFTMNAMAYNETEGLVDIFGGVSDLEKGIIKCVGNPLERFDEDALRILRAIRFSAQLNFQIDEGTKAAIREKEKFLEDISAERIQVELTKTITSDHPEKLIEAYELGVTKYIFPEFDLMMTLPQNNPHHIYNVGEHSIITTKNIENIPALRWAALLHDVGKIKCKTTDHNGIDHFYGHGDAGVAIASQILKRLKLDNETIHKAEKLIKWHDYGLDMQSTKNTLRKALNKMGRDIFPDYIKIRYADALSKNPEYLNSEMESIKNMEHLYEEIIKDNECLTIKELDINGNQLIELGVKQGKEIGESLNWLLSMVLENPALNKYSSLAEMIKNREK